LRVEGIEVIGELVRTVTKTGDTDSGLASNNALFVIGMPATEMRCFLFSRERVAASTAVR